MIERDAEPLRRYYFAASWAATTRLVMGSPPRRNRALQRHQMEQTRCRG